MGGTCQIAPDTGQQPGRPRLGPMLLCHLGPEAVSSVMGPCSMSILQTRLPISPEARASHHPTVSPSVKAGRCHRSSEP